MLLDESHLLLNACAGASRVIMALLPMYMGEPCCEEFGHCTGHYTDMHQRRICRGITDLYQAMVRWLSWIDQPNFFVVCPQVELMAVAKTLRVDRMSFLLAPSPMMWSTCPLMGTGTCSTVLPWFSTPSRGSTSPRRFGCLIG